VAAVTAAWREQARQQRADTLGHDPDLARHAWSNVSPADLRDAQHPLVARLAETGESEAHAGSICFLCQYTISATPVGEIDPNAIPWETDARQGLSALLGMCGDEMSREQAITALIDYYEVHVAGPARASGQAPMPLTREICRGHIDDVVLNPRAQRKMTVRRMERFERQIEHTSMRYNSVTRQCVPDVKLLNAYSRMVLAKDQIMVRIEQDEMASRGGSDSQSAKKAGWRFVRSSLPPQAFGSRVASSGPAHFPGTR
jgi:hypothetical protein